MIKHICILLISIILSCSGTDNSIDENIRHSMVQEFENDLFSQIKTSQLSLDYQSIASQQGLKYVTPTLPQFFKKIHKIPAVSKNLEQEFMQNMHSPPSIIHLGYSLLGSSAGGFGPPLIIVDRKEIKISAETDVKVAIEKLKQKINLLFISPKEKSWDLLPFQHRKTIIEMIYTLMRAEKILQQFISPISGIKPDFLHESNILNEKKLIEPWRNKQINSFSTIDAIGKVDLKKLSFASRIISERINALSSLSKEISPNFDECIINSSIGKIALFGKKNNNINGEYTLLIDFGGNDIYTGNVAFNNALSIPFSIVLDLEGNDLYNCEQGSLCKAVLGYSALIDCSGNDTYISGKSGIASSLYGTSLLIDKSGNDSYKSLSEYSQASSVIGLSAVLDYSGNDTYSCQSYSQGFGSTLGVGLLLDFSGDDKFSNQQLASFIQGAAKGRWAEATDGQNLAGGFGLFFNAEGNDSYNAASFSQGAAYYFGLGIFMDDKGSDSVNAISHSQGYAAHFALGCFMEGDGNDVYNERSNHQKITQIIGSGRDASAGICLDFAGNDRYHFGNRSLGVSDYNGIGIFWDMFGDDLYIHHLNALNKSAKSMGKVIQKDKNMQTGFRLFKNPVSRNLGWFHDRNGKDEIIQHE